MSIQLTTLDNGLRIVTEHMPALASATLGIWVDAGSRHEGAPQNGVAHFLEHMAFKGTSTRSALDIAESIEDVGGFINAYTSRDVTAYYVRLLQEHVPLGIDVLSDILQNPVFDPKDIAVERDVILQEIGMSNDTPDDIIFDWLQECAYPNQPIGRPILGPPDIVRTMQRETLAQFVGTHYSPENIVFSAAGAVDHEAIVAQVRALWDGRPRAARAIFEPARFVGGEARHEKTLEQAHIALSFEAPAIKDPDIFVAQIYSVAMGGGMSSRLFQEVREKRGLCYSIFAQMGAHSDTGEMTLYAGTSADAITTLGHVMMDELRKAPDTLTQAELERARAQMKSGMLMGLEGSSARAERLARVLQVHGRLFTVEDTVERIEAVTLEDLRSFAGKMAYDTPAAQALYGPVGKAPDLSALGLRSAA